MEYIITQEVLLFKFTENPRVVEAYIGEYASGKSEIAINRAIELRAENRVVNIVDLDTVEPFYTLRPIKKVLEEKGLLIIGSIDSFGLGETGAMLTPQAKWALMNEGDVIMDIGYGVWGARTLNLVEGANESSELKIIAVLNASRPMTNSKEKIVEYIKSLGRVDAIIANSHLGNETTLDAIKKGNQEIYQAAEELCIPVVYMAVAEEFKDLLKGQNWEVPVKYIRRYMPAAMW